MLLKTGVTVKAIVGTRYIVFLPALCLLLSVWSPAVAQPAGTLHPESLRVEYARNPLGLDTPEPRLSWIVTSEKRAARQTAYRLLVASHPDTLAAGRGDVWDSGKVTSDATVHIAYDGAPLQSGRRYHWKARAWDGDGEPSAWSAPAFWSMGLLETSDWKAEWIGAPEGALDSTEAHAARLLRSEFPVEKEMRRATAYVSGLGYYELMLNGEKVGDHLLDPGFTDYSDRVLYVTYDVTEDLRAGPNAVGAVLGTGFYYAATPDLFGFQSAPWRAPPKLLLQIEIEYEDGTTETITSNEDWRWATGQITYNSIRGGETIDAREKRDGWAAAGYDASDWQPVAVLPAPEAELAAQHHPPMRITEVVPPEEITEPAPDTFVVDFGKNLTGAVRLTASGAAGQEVTLHFNEVLREEGTLDTAHSASHTYGRFQKGVFVLSGESADVYEPRFTYHGFRYVQITGLREAPAPEDMRALAIHTDLESDGHFSSSNPRLNQLQSAIRRTLLNSAHGLPAEEPTREKMGWTYDALVEMEAYLYNFDAARLYAKFLKDMIDAQDPNGHMPPIAPTPGIWRTDEDGAPGDFADPWWGATLAYVPWTLYEFYADRRAVETAYPHVKEYVAYLRSRADPQDFTLDWRLGDWLDRTWRWDGKGVPGLTPVVQSSTAAFYSVAEITSRMANLLGRPEEAEQYRNLADSIRTQFNARFLDEATGLYQDSSQTAQATPLWLGMVPEEQEEAVFERLVEHVTGWDTTATAGFVGAFPMMEELAERGRADLAYAMLMNEDGPGWLYFVEDSTSTLGENLNPEGYGTGHHPYAAFIGFWPYRALAGLRPDLDAPGFKHTVIRPAVVDGLDWAEAHYDSVHGRIQSRWERDENRLALTVTVPANTTATVHLPTTDPDGVRESGQPAAEAEGLDQVRVEEGRVVYRIGSGTYTFTSDL